MSEEVKEGSVCRTPGGLGGEQTSQLMTVVVQRIRDYSEPVSSLTSKRAQRGCLLPKTPQHERVSGKNKKTNSPRPKLLWLICRIRKQG